MRYDLLVCDADDTLLDFARAERAAFFETLRAHGAPADETAFDRYRAINEALWRAFERGRITQTQLKVERFAQWLAQTGAPGDAGVWAEDYAASLSRQGFLLPGALAVVQEIAARIPIVLVTNGIASIQRGRLNRSGLTPYLTDVLISEETGFAKPDPGMVKLALARTGAAPARTLLAGDSLRADIAAAHAAGVDSCYLAPPGATGGATHVIHDIRELPAVALA